MPTDLFKVIVRNAARLTKITSHYFCWQADAIFPKCESLEIDHDTDFGPEANARFPALRHLDVNFMRRGHFLKHMSIEKLESLWLVAAGDLKPPFIGIPEFVTYVSRAANLTKFRFAC